MEIQNKLHENDKFNNDVKGENYCPEDRFRDDLINIILIVSSFVAILAYATYGGPQSLNSLTAEISSKSFLKK